jgi:2-oxoglutarate dehydrogenase E1 component
LRRQMKRDFIKPLILMTPKSLLRAEFSTSRAEDFTSGKFHEIIPDRVTGIADPRRNAIERVILCAGKVYFDLIGHREKEKIANSVIIRIEQLYPLDEQQLRAAVEAFPKEARLVWCQEESQNMGAWSFIEPRLRAMFGREVGYAGRNASASPAVGALALHKREQASLIAEAFSV